MSNFPIPIFNDNPCVIENIDQYHDQAMQDVQAIIDNSPVVENDDELMNINNKQNEIAIISLPISQSIVP